jgi:hypothetical protein
MIHFEPHFNYFLVVLPYKIDDYNLDLMLKKLSYESIVKKAYDRESMSPSISAGFSPMQIYITTVHTPINHLKESFYAQ